MIERVIVFDEQSMLIDVDFIDVIKVFVYQKCFGIILVVVKNIFFGLQFLVIFLKI